MRSLGIDPGLVRTGWAVVEPAGRRAVVVAHGVIAPPTAAELPARLAEGARQLRDVVAMLELRIGVPAEYFGEGLDPEIRAAIEKSIDGLRASGCEVKTIALPHTKYAIPVYYLVATAEAFRDIMGQKKV